jgi:hypothetical protein
MAALGTDRTDLRSATLGLLEKLQPIAGPAGAETVAELRELLTRPAVVAVAGRVNTGKSTLVNALIGTTLAPTSAQETTSLLSYYAYGSPSRAEAISRSGRMTPVPLTPTGPLLPDLSVEDCECVRVFLQSAALRTITIVDTPGLGSAATENYVRTEVGLLTGGGTAKPDVLLYLVRDAFRPDDEEFISRFTARGAGIHGGVSVPVVGLLSHADNFGGGPWLNAEPVDAAAEAASALSTRMPMLADVVPISGLLAETARTGAFREADLRHLRTLRDASDHQLQFPEQLGYPAGISSESFTRLTQLIGAYGIRQGRFHSGSSAGLMNWLESRSGLDHLEKTLHRVLSETVERTLILRIFNRLTESARRENWSTDARSMIESARHAPVFHQLNEWSALELLRATAPQHHLIGVLESLLTGAPEHPAEPTSAASNLSKAAQYQAMVGAAASGAEAQAARVIARTFLIRSGVSV